MFRVAAAAVLCLLGSLALTTSAFAGDARVTRIEPRPFYGATVTLEAGVRVFRPLPPHKHIIINPGHRTPLNVTIKDVTEKRTIKGEINHNYYDRSGGYVGGYASSFPYGGFARHRGKRRAYRGGSDRGHRRYVHRAPKFGGRARGGRGGGGRSGGKH